MEKIKKVLLIRIINLIIIGDFLFSACAYPLTINSSNNLRVPLASSDSTGRDRQEELLSQVSTSLPSTQVIKELSSDIVNISKKIKDIIMTEPEEEYRNILNAPFLIPEPETDSEAETNSEEKSAFVFFKVVIMHYAGNPLQAINLYLSRSNGLNFYRLNRIRKAQEELKENLERLKGFDEEELKKQMVELGLNKTEHLTEDDPDEKLKAVKQFMAVRIEKFKPLLDELDSKISALDELDAKISDNIEEILSEVFYREISKDSLNRGSVVSNGKVYKYLYLDFTKNKQRSMREYFYRAGDVFVIDSKYAGLVPDQVKDFKGKVVYVDFNEDHVPQGDGNSHVGTYHYRHDTILLLIGMQLVDLTGKTTVDAGAGNGIIGIVAALYQAKKVYILERQKDFEALLKKNAQENGVIDIFDFTNFGRTFENLNKDGTQQSADIVLMNISKFGTDGELSNVLNAFNCKQVIVAGGSYRDFGEGYIKDGPDQIDEAKIKNDIIEKHFEPMGLKVQAVVEAKIYPYDKDTYASFILNVGPVGALSRDITNISRQITDIVNAEAEKGHSEILDRDFFEGQTVYNICKHFLSSHIKNPLAALNAHLNKPEGLDSTELDMIRKAQTQLQESLGNLRDLRGENLMEEILMKLNFNSDPEVVLIGMREEKLEAARKFIITRIDKIEPLFHKLEGKIAQLENQISPNYRKSLEPGLEAATSKHLDGQVRNQNAIDASL